MATKIIATSASAPPAEELELDFTIGGNRGGGPGPTNGNLVAALPRDPSATAAETGVWVAVAAIAMCFASLISAMIVRQGAAPDWLNFPLPRILYLNTLVLLVSSVSLEVSRHWFATAQNAVGQEPRQSETRVRALAWLYATMALGLLFVAGQVIAWRALFARGLFLSSSPSSSFFYVMTALHGVHLFGGVLGLAYVVYRLTRRAGAHETRVLGVASVYWHFMDGLWIFLLIVLSTRV
jgi:cytochrome c oxidase subunit 3